MKGKVGGIIWVVATAIVVVVTSYIIGRNAVHAMKIRSQINTLQDERESYLEQIERDSTLLENLQYDDYLEQYAREEYNMQRGDEELFLMEDDI